MNEMCEMVFRTSGDNGRDDRFIVTGKGTRSSSLIHCHRDYVNLDAEKRWHGCESYSIGRRKPLPRIVAPVILDYVSLLTGYVSYLATADVRCAGIHCRG